MGVMVLEPWLGLLVLGSCFAQASLWLNQKADVVRGVVKVTNLLRARRFSLSSPSHVF